MGEYGLGSVEQVAKDMIRSFPNIRISLSGSGAPSQKRGIRLGDVVVSIPYNSQGSVPHYNFPKRFILKVDILLAFWIAHR